MSCFKMFIHQCFYILTLDVEYINPNIACFINSKLDGCFRIEWIWIVAIKLCYKWYRGITCIHCYFGIIRISGFPTTIIYCCDIISVCACCYTYIKIEGGGYIINKITIAVYIVESKIARSYCLI